MYTILLVPSVKNWIQIEVELVILNKLPTLNYPLSTKNRICELTFSLIELTAGKKTMWGSPWESFHLVDRT